jgi:putative phosphoribosyl transferase
MAGRHDAIDPIHVHAGDHELRGTLAVPEGAVGLVICAGAIDRYIADALRARGLATLVVELELSADERYDIELLAMRLVAVTDRIGERSNVAHLPLGYVGAGTGTAAALVAAARRPEHVRALALCGGRADLAGSALRLVRAPTLFIAPGNHENSLDIDRAAIEEMTTSTQFAIVPAASPRFEGALDDVVQLAAEWLIDHFARALAVTDGGKLRAGA